MICCHLYIRIDGNHFLLGAFHLRGVQVLGLVDDLSLQVAEATPAANVKLNIEL